MLASEDDIHVTTEADTVREAIDEAGRTRPDVVVMDRMESHSTPGEIQITRATYELLKYEFVCRRRGTILVKVKGRMETRYLVGPRSDDGRTDRGVNSEARNRRSALSILLDRPHRQ
jgi:class 3 adenylate cyclase